MDVGLPMISGLEMLQEIPNNKKNVPLMIITARDSIEDRIIGLDTGAHNNLNMPEFMLFKKVAQKI